MTDIVDRLRGKNAVVPKDPCLCDEAADLIEWLRAERYAWEAKANEHYSEAFMLRTDRADAEALLRYALEYVPDADDICAWLARMSK